MSERIHESILITRNADASPHIAPMGLRERDGLWLIAPFVPSRTLDNLLRDRVASINFTDDVRVYAGCLGGRPHWPLCECERIDGLRLRDALSHREVRLVRVGGGPDRPSLYCEALYEANHQPFRGFNRAQAAVLELAILVSRLDRLPAAKVRAEVEYLSIAVEKTAGEQELEAWNWLMQRVRQHAEAKACA